MSSETLIILYVLLGIAYLIITISMIIKYFEMAKNIKCLNENFGNGNDSLEFLIINDFKEEAKRILLREIWDEDEMYALRNNPSNNPTIKEFDRSYNYLKNKYDAYFIAIGEPFPTYNCLKQK